MTSTPQDDSFHEIQLSGKQLFFVFMAATVVSVVIFLCGVLVGRGVRAERTAVAEAELLNTSPRADAQPSLLSDATLPAPVDRTIVPPPPAGDPGDLGDDLAEIRPNRPLVPDAPVKADGPKQEPAKADKSADKTTPSANVAKAESARAPSSATPVASDSWTVQVAAPSTRDDADTWTKRLATKGYTAYVVTPSGGTSIYRVRVGGFKSKREADVIADRLRKDLQVKPWVTR